LPDGKNSPGIVLLHEALRVTDYTRSVADRLAELGCVTVAPDLVWRIEDRTASFLAANLASS
jgi:dienelactone hydrolase